MHKVFETHVGLCVIYSEIPIVQKVRSVVMPLTKDWIDVTLNGTLCLTFWNTDFEEDQDVSCAL